MGNSTEINGSGAPQAGPAPDEHLEIVTSELQDSSGETRVTDELPSAETIKTVENFLVLDGHGRSHAFKTLYNGPNVARRVLVIFIRHFFCGSCQDFIKALTEAVTPESLLSLPVSTFITIVGCGDPALIEDYASHTGCRFPIYTDPRGSLFDALGMLKTLSMGPKPAYARRPMFKNVMSSVAQTLGSIPRGLAHKGGDPSRIGGEFLFEPQDLVTPVSSPLSDGNDGPVEEKRVTWCNRMKSTRSHCEIEELMEILGVDADGLPVSVRGSWSGTRERKGTGQSMASQMTELLAAEKERASRGSTSSTQN